MSLHPSNSRRSRAFNIFVGGFFIAVMGVMIVAGIFAEREITSFREIISRIAGFGIVTLISLVLAVRYYRGATKA